MMTREEAIALLAESKRQNEVMRDNPSTFWESHKMADGVKNAERRIAALDMAIDALDPPNEPLPVLVNDEPDREYIDYICPRCKEIISQRRHGQRMETVYQCRYHDNCGQRVDWSSPQPYRRPPEGEEET